MSTAQKCKLPISHKVGYIGAVFGMQNVKNTYISLSKLFLVFFVDKAFLASSVVQYNAIKPRKLTSCDILHKQKF